MNQEEILGETKENTSSVPLDEKNLRDKQQQIEFEIAIDESKMMQLEEEIKFATSQQEKDEKSNELLQLKEKDRKLHQESMNIDEQIKNINQIEASQEEVAEEKVVKESTSEEKIVEKPQYYPTEPIENVEPDLVDSSFEKEKEETQLMKREEESFFRRMIQKIKAMLQKNQIPAKQKSQEDVQQTVEYLESNIDETLSTPLQDSRFVKELQSMVESPEQIAQKDLVRITEELERRDILEATKSDLDIQKR